jgi:oligopeptide transport system ATP-binding protein
MSALLQIDALGVSYDARGKSRRHAVRAFTLSMEEGEIVAIIGESGSGKSQIFMAALRLLARDAEVDGSVRFDGQDVLSMSPAALNAMRGSQIAMIFQDPMSALNPHLDIATQLAEVLVAHRSLSWRTARAAAAAMLARVQISEPQRRLAQYPHELSGGMRQRVTIAMALMCNPRLLIADEPTTALDSTVQAQIMNLLRELHSSLRMAVVFISHDLAQAFGFARRIIVMYAGRIVESAPAREMFHGALHPYSAALLACIPGSLASPSSAPHSRLPSLPGQPPDAADLEAGCAFAPRCSRVQPRCRVERPLFEAKRQGRWAACHFPL